MFGGYSQVKTVAFIRVPGKPERRRGRFRWTRERSRGAVLAPLLVLPISVSFADDVSRVRDEGADTHSDLVGTAHVDVLKCVEGGTAHDVHRGPLRDLRSEGLMPCGLRDFPALLTVHIRELAAAVPLREVQEGRPEEPRQAKGSGRVPRTLARRREVRQGLREEGDSLERDPRIGVVPERRVRAEAHQEQDIPAGDEGRAFRVEAALQDALRRIREIRLARTESLSTVVRREHMASVGDREAPQRFGPSPDARPVKQLLCAPPDGGLDSICREDETVLPQL